MGASSSEVLALVSDGVSGERRLRQPEQLVGLGNRRRKPIIVSTQPGDLELETPNLGAQNGDLVDEASVGRVAYVAVEGLRHIFSFECAAGLASNARP
jgi:hypothetical protein